MPKCAKCGHLMPPNLCTLKDVTLNEYLCVFCERDIKEIKINTRGYDEIYTKEDCEKDYIMMLKELKDKPNIADVLAKSIKKQ